MKRVVITGLGLVTSLGHTVEETWEALCQGRSGIGPICQFDASEYPVRFAGEVRDFDPSRYLGHKDIRRNDAFTHLAVAASRQALEQARLSITEQLAPSIGVCIGSGIGGLMTLHEQFAVLQEKGPTRVSPFLVPMMMINAAAGVVSLLTGAQGPTWAAVSACATGANALGEAWETIRRGAARAMLAGGAEKAVTPLAMAAFANMHALSRRNDNPPGASRPFDAERDGFVMGEGAGILLLEELDFALERGAPILAELVGYGATADAYHITEPAPGGEGLVRAMRIALQSAGLRPEEVQYINAHGTATPLNDATETQAIKACFGNHAYHLALSSSKSMLGHTFGAAGAIEAAITVLSIVHGMIPPTINLDHPDPACDLDYVPHQARRSDVRVALSNSMGFGGHNACLIFKRYEPLTFLLEARTIVAERDHLDPPGVPTGVPQSSRTPAGQPDEPPAQLPGKRDDPVALAVKQFVTPRSFERNARERAYLLKGTPLPLKTPLAAVEWGQGPPVLLVHGWEGRGTQMSAFIDPLVAAGRRVIAYDGPAHGDSPGEKTNPWHFAQALVALAQELGPLEGIIAYSMGAGSTVVALSQGVSVQRLVLLASIASLKGGLHRFADAVGLPPHLFPAFQDGVQQEIDVPLEALELDALRPHFLMPALLFHDPDDQEVPFADGQALAHAWPGAQLRAIGGSGHRRMLYEPKVVQEAVAFITGTDSFSNSTTRASGGPF